MRRLLAWAGLSALGFAVLMTIAAAPAGAASASPGSCSGNATSANSGGKQLSKVAAPGAGGTKSDPFEITTDGSVDYTYKLGGDVAGGTWKVVLLGPLSFSGDISDTAASSGSGSEALKKHFQVGGLAPLVGLIKADVVVENKDGSTVCTYSGWIKIGGSILETPVTYAAVVLVGLGGLLAFGAMGRPV